MWWKTSNTTLFMVTMVALVLVPVSPVAADDDPDTIASGHIKTGVFFGYPAYSWVYSILFGTLHDHLDTPFSFSADIHDHRGQWVETVVVDNTGLGHYVDLYFFNEQHHWYLEAECEATEDVHGLAQPPIGFHEIRTRCLVPEDAETVVVTAHTGVDLDVDLIRL